MLGMLIAKFAKFSKFHTVWVGFFVLFHVIIPLLAIQASQCNFASHNIFTSWFFSTKKATQKNKPFWHKAMLSQSKYPVKRFFEKIVTNIKFFLTCQKPLKFAKNAL